MKIFFALLFFSLAAHAETVFTTVSYDGEQYLYTGIKKQEAGIHSAIAVVDSKDFSFEFISLPEKIAARDVIGLIPDGEKIFAITQITAEQNDNPMLSVYNRSTKKWKDINSVDCPIFTQVSFSSNALVFHCEELRKKKKSKVKKKSIHLGSEHIHRKGSMRFPEFLIRYKKIDIRLEGQALAWNSLHFKKDGQDKSITAAKIFEGK